MDTEIKTIDLVAQRGGAKPKKQPKWKPVINEFLKKAGYTVCGPALKHGKGWIAPVEGRGGYIWIGVINSGGSYKIVDSSLVIK